MAAGDNLRIRVTEPGTGIEMAAVERATDADLLEGVVIYGGDGNKLSTTNPTYVTGARPTATTTTMTSSGVAAVCALNGEMGCSVMFSGTYGAATLLFETSIDGGTTYIANTATNSNPGTGTIESAAVGLTANLTALWIITAPPGATHVRLSALVAPPTGTLNIRFTPGSLKAPHTQVVTVRQDVAHDGTNDAYVVQTGGHALETKPTAVNTNDRVRSWHGLSGGQMVHTQPHRRSAYQVVTAEIAPAITIGVKELCTLFHPSAQTVDYFITEIWVNSIITTASTGTGRTTILVERCNTAPTGGTAITPSPIDNQAASGATFQSVKTGGGAVVGVPFIRREWLYGTQPLGRVSEPVFQSSNLDGAIVLRGGADLGINVREERVAAHTAMVEQVTVTIRWIEL